jgi:excisionase family DNA binding protein
MKLTVKQAAERGGVSVQLVYKLCSEHSLPHYRVGGRGRRGKILIEEADLAAFFEGCKVNAQDTTGPHQEGDSVPPRPMKSPSPGTFTMLDAGRLREAWRRQGGPAGRRGPRSARSSA